MNTNVKTELLKIFEPELLEKILQSPIIEMPKNFSGESMQGGDGSIPILLEGKVSLHQRDSLGNEVKIYDINPAQSCIIAINSSLSHRTIAKTYVYAPEKSKMVMIPKEKSEFWFDEYKSWRRFVVNLYGKRLKELLSKHNAVSEQKVAIEERNEKITASINYAKRIQQAVFPSEEFLKNAGWDYFIYFEPRDIVSGDFYWIAKEGEKITIAAADATGHGVPGAFMSLLGIAYLNEMKELISEDDLAPNIILEKLRQKIKVSLNQTGKDGEAKDGMDIAMCTIDTKTRMLQYSGAHNPVYIFREETGEFIEIKSDRQPIGIHLRERPFTNHEIQLKKGDVFYIFSDGYVDQFGGKRGGKFKTKQFKEILQSIYKENMNEQKKMLNEIFQNWKGNLDQIDDVLVIGVRV